MFQEGRGWLFFLWITLKGIKHLLLPLSYEGILDNVYCYLLISEGIV